jgi:pyridoxamine 5'-phosphate oxidase
MRLEYETHGLDPSEADPDPLVQFQRWFTEAITAGVYEANAMVLSTVDGEGRPWARHLLLKGLSDGGFEFYTNYRSRKGRHLAANPWAALTFGWLALHRQVCVTGRVEVLSDAESDAYFALRPRGGQLGAWASLQSSPLASRDELEVSYRQVEDRFAGGRVPRPDHWGGYRLRPSEVEFWQGRANRLHDRVRYAIVADGGWDRRRLPP